MLISIHAPLRERPEYEEKSVKNFIFQSTLPYGSDLSLLELTTLFTIFQSTLPYGSDIMAFALILMMRYFNPRSLTGATYHHEHQFHNNAISIHAPLRELR